MDIERFSRALEHFSDRPSGTHGASQSGRENGAIVDRDNVVRARGCETDLQKIMGPTPRMKYRTAPTRAVRVNQVCDRRDDIRLRQCLGHKRTLPEVVFGKRPVLQSAATTAAEMLADRTSAFVAGFIDMQEMTPVRMARDVPHRDGFTGKGIGHVDHAIGSIGDAVAAMAKPRDCELFSHAQLQAGIRCFRRRR
jgi:hypothetical protein